MKPYYALAAAWCFVSAVEAQQPAPRIQLSIDDEDGMVAVGEQVTFTARVSNKGQMQVMGQLEWTVQTVAFEPPATTRQQVTIPADDAIEVTYALALPTHGFANVECRLVREGEPDAKPVSRSSRIGALPARVTSPSTAEKDFDSFWKASLAELKQVDPQFEVVAKPERARAGIEVFEVSMRSHGKVRVRGWLEVPQSKDAEGVTKQYPVVIRVPGYGGNMKPIGKWDDMIVFSFNPRAHGNSQDDVPGKPVDYWIRGLDDKETYYYRGAYLDCIRAIDFIASRNDVDMNRIAVWGGSQGGGFAFAMAALDARVDYCVADIPFLCDWDNYFQLTQWPEMDKWIAARESRTWKTTLRTLSYFDTMNLCDRITCPTLMSVGLQDPICPPTTNFAAYNRIAGKKQYKIYPGRGHGLGSQHWLWVWAQLRSEFAVNHDDPAPEKNIFDVQQKNQTEVFVAADVPKKVSQGVKETLAVAVDTWGSSGRMEYWVLGTDREAAVALAKQFCQRRVARGQMSEQACLADSENKDHGFLMYQQIGADAVKSGRARGSAGHNGGAQWGFHRMTSSLPLGFAGLLNIPGEGEQVTILHEYWHSIQNAHIQTTEHRKRRELMGPVWFVEGSAVAMAETTAARLWASKKLPRWKNTTHTWQSLEERMTNKMRIVQSKRKDCATLLPNSYDSDCRQLAYESGAWAIALLMHRHGQDVLLKSFHPQVEKLGWEGAFQKTFGQSSTEFKADFEKFMDLPLSEQVKILPQ